MADLSKFEEMLERLVNEDRQGAEELFHEIVVERSRDIYESLLESEEAEYGFEEADEVGGDATDDLMADLGMTDDEEDEEDYEDVEDDEDEDNGDEEVEDRVEDLEDAIDDLKAEFERLMAGEAEDELEDTGEEDEDYEEEGDEEDEGEEDEEAAPVREYVEKVTPKMGDHGTNTKSAVASEQDWGGTTDNIARDDEEGKGPAPKKPEKEDADNVNVPGGKASKSLKAQGKGHGAEKKGEAEKAENKTSVIRSHKDSRRK